MNLHRQDPVRGRCSTHDLSLVRDLPNGPGPLQLAPNLEREVLIRFSRELGAPDRVTQEPAPRPGSRADDQGPARNPETWIGGWHIGECRAIIVLDQGRFQ